MNEPTVADLKRAYRLGWISGVGLMLFATSALWFRVMPEADPRARSFAFIVQLLAGGIAMTWGQAQNEREMRRFPKESDE